MTDHTAEPSLFGEVLHLYATWRTRHLVYVTVLVLGTGVALILDTRFLIGPATVLLFALPLTAALMIALPAAYVAFRRSGYYETVRQNILSIPGMSARDTGRFAVKYPWFVPRYDSSLKTKVAARRRLQKLEEMLARVSEGSVAFAAQNLTVNEEIESKIIETKRTLTTVRLRQLDLRLSQSGISAPTKLVLNHVLKGLRAIAQRDVEIVPDDAPETFRSGFEKGLDSASAALFYQIAVILAEDSFRNERENYPKENAAETLESLAEEERLWLFKYEAKP